MGHLAGLFPDQFSGNKEEWKQVLQRELKLPDIEQKLQKNTLEGLFEILSLEISGQVIPNLTSWKKASQTYFSLDAKSEDSVKEDLESGVRVFFLNEKTSSLEKIISSHVDAKDIDVIYFGEKTKALNAFHIQTQGGTHLQEIGALTVELIKWCESNPTKTSCQVMISTDNHFFQSIAKIRAFREISEKVFQSFKMKVELKIISVVNTREWTLFDRYNNMLRNTAAVAAALIGGADIIQSLGYMAPFEMEASEIEEEHLKRARRMARNTSHILSLESMLGMVQDAAAGSYHLESLTNFYSEGGWNLMQKLISLSSKEATAYWNEELAKIQKDRLKQFNHRKLILSGINDFPNVKEELHLKEIKKDQFRLARGFEELRLRVEKLPANKKVNVRIAFWGDYAALNARVNFTKNYFELLGLHVFDPGHSLDNLGEFKSWMDQGKPNEIIVLCAKDEDYNQLVTLVTFSPTANFVAGKVEVSNYVSIFGGQDVFAVLSSLVTKLESLS